MFSASDEWSVCLRLRMPPALGAAVLAAVGAQLYPTLAQAVKAMRSRSTRFVPDMAALCQFLQSLLDRPARHRESPGQIGGAQMRALGQGFGGDICRDVGGKMRADAAA